MHSRILARLVLVCPDLPDHYVGQRKSLFSAGDRHGTGGRIGFEYVERDTPISIFVRNRTTALIGELHADVGPRLGPKPKLLHPVTTPSDHR